MRDRTLETGALADYAAQFQALQHAQSAEGQRKAAVLEQLKRLSMKGWEQMKPSTLQEIFRLDSSASWQREVTALMGAAERAAERAQAQAQAQSQGVPEIVARLEGMNSDELRVFMASQPDGGAEVLRALSQADKLG